MFTRAVAPFLLVTCFAGTAFAQPSSTTGRPTVLIHGNYCGPGNNAPLAPVDALDAACARHDACTPDGAPGSKTCNMRLQVEAERLVDDPSQPEDLRMMAGLVATGAAMMPSAASGTVAEDPGPAAHRYVSSRRSASARSQAYGG